MKAKRFSYFVLGLSLLSQVGCLSTVALMGSVAGTATYFVTDRRRMESVLMDEALEWRIARRIKKIQGDNSFVRVTSYNSIVLLTGDSFNIEKKVNATEIARAVKDVRNVINLIEVRPNASTSSRMSDRALKARISSALALKKAKVGPTAIKIVADRGVVYLMGMVTPKEGASVVEYISRVKGVQKVVEIFEYKEDNSSPSNKEKEILQKTSMIQ